MIATSWSQMDRPMCNDKISKSDNLFLRRNEEKERIRMRDYNDPEYGKAVFALLNGAAPAPVRAKIRR